MPRPPTIRARFDRELIVDSFAGGGGASTGIELALGRSPDIAINHDPEAIAMHAANHPSTRHFCESVWKVDPLEATGGKPVGLMWLSPDCKFFSRAKGAKPVNKEIRGLAWVAVRWARAVRPRAFVLENVEEFADWGPLVNDRPCPNRRGLTFRRFVGSLRNLGYQVEFRSLVAADYGAPTTRKRLYLIARCDGEPIRWPVPTHGRGRSLPWRAAAEIIDWSLACPSIFGRERPLAEKTLARIAEGVRRYVLECAHPFIAPIAHHGEHALASPTLVTASWGEREGQTPRVPGLEKPLGTLVAGGIKHALVAAFLSKHFGGVVGHGVQRALGTVTAKDHHAVSAAFLTKFQQNSSGTDMREPTHTIMAGATRFAEVRALLTTYYGSGAKQRGDLFSPLATVTAHDRFGLVLVDGEPYQIADIGMRMLAPRELYRAQGFPDGYVIDEGPGGRALTKTAQVRMVGNSVAPPVAAAIVRTNVGTARDEAAA